MGKFVLPEDFKTSNEVLDLMHQNAVKSLEHTDDMNQLVTSKTQNLLSVLVSLISACIGYIVLNCGNITFVSLALITTFVLTSSFALVCLVRALSVKLFNPTCFEPRNYLNALHLSKFDIKKFELENLQNMITENNKHQNNRAKLYDKAIKVFAFSPLISIAITLFCYFLVLPGFVLWISGRLLFV